jgi:short-subunit dehydrogenase
MELNGAWVLITGASRGIGVFIAEEFAKRKANIILVARSMNGLQKTSDQIRKLGGKAHSISFDLRNISKMEALVRDIKRLTPFVDVIINNAGLEKYCHFSEYRSDDIVSLISVNLIAPMELTRLLLPDMLNRKRGHIINISSLGGKVGEIYNSIYSASKGGMDLWSGALRQELYGTGVKISVISPGYVTDSGMIYNIGVKTPPVIGNCTARDVAVKVIKSVMKSKSQMIVNSRPVKPFIIANLIFPGVVDAMARWIGISKLNKEKVARRAKLEALEKQH